MDLAEVRCKMGKIGDEISRKQLEAEELKGMVEGVSAELQTITGRSGSNSTHRRGVILRKQSMSEQVAGLRQEIKDK